MGLTFELHARGPRVEQCGVARISYSAVKFDLMIPQRHVSLRERNSSINVCNRLVTLFSINQRWYGTKEQVFQAHIIVLDSFIILPLTIF